MNKLARLLTGLLFAAMATTAYADGSPAEETSTPPAPAAPEPAAEAPAPVQEAPAAEAAAPEAPAEPGNKLYAGLGLNFVRAEVGSDKATITGGNLRVGYFVLPWLAIEGQVLDGFTKPDLNKVNQSNADLRPSYAVYLKPHHTFGNFDTFLSLGYADTKLRVVDSPSRDVGDKDFSYGIGTRIPTSAGAFDFEYQRLLDKKSVTAQGLSFSYVHFFNW